MTTPTPSERVAEQERSASSMATYPGRVVKAEFARMLAVELESAERDLAAAREELAQERQWREAVLNELIVAHIYTKEHDTNPTKAIHDAITWNCQVALDPAVSSDAQALIAQERERAELAEARAAANEKDAKRWKACLDSVGVAVSIFNVDPCGWRYPEGDHLVAAIDNIIEGNEGAWMVPIDTGGPPPRAPFELKAQSRESVEARFYRYLRDEAGGNEDKDGPMICAGLGDQFDFLRGEECDEAIRKAIDARAAIAGETP